MRWFMRRALSILLVLFFGLGPLSATLEADEARLPACCRAHGAHHCAMSAALKAWMLRAESQTPSFTAPSTCPLYRTLFDQDSTPENALLTTPPAAPASGVRRAVVADYRFAARSIHHAIRTGRGPPATSPA
jgi:hypothetical protein